MIILKRIALAVLIIMIFTAMVVFTTENPGNVTIQLFGWQESPPISLAFTAAFIVGWLFGIVCMGLYAFKVAKDRRHLRRSLRLSENEVSSLRSLPLHDAD